MEAAASQGLAGSRPKFEALAGIGAPGGRVVAVGPTAREGIFIAYIEDVGFKYLDISSCLDGSSSGSKGRWSPASAHVGPVAGELGLFHYEPPQEGEEGAAAFVSLAEEAAPGAAKSWACFRIPAWPSSAEKKPKAAAAAVLAGRSSALPAALVAACAEPGDTAAAILLASGQVRFMSLENGEAAGKGLKFETKAEEGRAMALARLGPCRAAMVRETDIEAPLSLEFFLVSFDTQARRAVLERRGLVRAGGTRPAELGPLRGVAAAGSEGQQPGKDQILLCWGSSETSKGGSTSSSGGLTFASAALDSNSPTASMVLLPKAGSGGATSSSELRRSWTSVAGYLAEWSVGKDGPLKMTVRDAKFGMQVISGEVQWATAASGAGKRETMAVATAGKVTLLASGQGLSALLWTMPQFSLHMVIGGRATAAPAKADGKLRPLREVIAGKRARDEPEVQELFAAKKRKSSESALVEAVRKRLWKPSHELVDAIVHYKCWAAGSALLALPDLEEGLAVRLLAAHSQFLARLVRRCRAPQSLEKALRENLPTSALPEIVETCLEWLAAHRDFPESLLQEKVPGMPGPLDIVRFLKALADGCLAALARLDEDLLERVLERLSSLQGERARTEKLYGAVRSCFRQRRPAPVRGSAPVIEVALLPL
eukprot:TRINITY_DN104007_c0_g1_i1.p1 TRINITY_DN104007_c0_g1~~TRINITY_DN104007_c0_g1_i1.p1  ORF type:complete len:691 (-),score=153.00 TRINITY_DN104007_c0_g1_i1:72-2039(-)